MKRLIIWILFLFIFLSACSTYEVESSATGIDYAISFFEYDPPLEYVQNDISDFRISKKFIDGKWAYVDEQGKVLPYSHMSSFYGELSIVSSDERYGLVNYALELVVPTDYDVLVMDTNLKLGHFPVFYAKKDGQWSIIDTSCNEIRTMLLSYRTEPDVNFDDVAVIIINGDVVLVEPENNIPIVAYVPLDIYQDEQTKTLGQHIDLVQGHFENQLQALYNGSGDYIMTRGYALLNQQVDLANAKNTWAKSASQTEAQADSIYYFIREEDGAGLAIVKMIGNEETTYEIIRIANE